VNRRWLIATIVFLTVPTIVVVRSTLIRAEPSHLPLVEEATVQQPSRDANRSAQPRARMSITEAVRLEQRRMLYETVDGLLQVGEFERARRLLDQDQENYQDGAKPWLDLAQGYRLLADCLEHPDTRFRGSAEAFLRTSEAPALSPKLRTACFEPR
jgi:hypothetical protein